MYTHIKPRTVCKDGFSMSVQASEFHYCEPRNNAGPYTHLEVGFPSDYEELLLPYAEMYMDGEDTGIYPRVPAEVVEAIISKHGGLYNV